MSNLKLFKADIEFKVNGKPVKFSVYHNLPKIKGMSMDDAVENWVHRTKVFSAKSLCRYIMSKHTEYVCMTEGTFRLLNEKK